jgi:effector-binding domain-containing protein
MNKEIIVERQRHKMAEEVFKAEYKKLDEAYRKERGI